MSLSSVLDVSRSSLATSAELTQIASRNIGRASDPAATRKIARLVTTLDGAPRVASIERASTTALREGVAGAHSEAARLDTIAKALDRLDLTGGDGQGAASPSARMGAVRAALQLYSTNPSDVTSASNVVNAAADLSSTLKSWARNVDDVRQQAGQEIVAAVANVNTMLGQITTINSRIVNATATGADVTDDLDARDALVAKLAEQVGVNVIQRSNNGIALFADSGLTLFDVVPRQVKLDAGPLMNGVAGPRVIIDGVAATGNGSVMPIASGRIAGLIEVRDKVALTVGAQLDEIASGLVRAFAEADQSVPATLPDAAGLFVLQGSGGLPPAGTWVPGAARLIEVNANVDPGQGGNVMLLRDGGISNPSSSAYVYNLQGRTGFSGRIEQLTDALSTPLAFSSQAKLSMTSSVADFSTSAAGWLQGQRQTVGSNLTYANALLQRSQDALNREAGVNVDDEMIQLLELERTYQASAKLISTVDSMFAALLQSVR